MENGSCDAPSSLSSAGMDTVPEAKGRGTLQSTYIFLLLLLMILEEMQPAELEKPISMIK